MNTINIRHASVDDAAVIAQHDKHVAFSILNDKIERHEVLVVHEGDIFAGWLRYSLFWDNTPFMNMLFLLPEYRSKGIGKQLVLFWEEEMKGKGYKMVLTSTQQNESTQHFYVALGYKATGGFHIEGEPFEIIFAKKLLAIRWNARD